MENIVGDDDNTLINFKDINDLKKCVEFKNNLGYNVETKDKDFFKLFKENVEKNKDIEIYFTRYVNAYNDLNKLFQNTFDKSAISKQIIISICANSVFILKNKGHNFFKGYYKIEEKGKENMEKINLKIPKLKELRDRALLTKKVINENKNKEIFKSFVDNVSILIKLNELIKEIYSCGYVEDIELKINWKNNQIKFSVRDLESSKSEKVIELLTKIRDDFKKNI